MGRVILIFLLITYSFAKINIHSFYAKFNQKITNEQNSSLLYKGEVFFQSPNSVKWEYKYPFKKSIILKNNIMTIIEPELEQAIIKEIDKEISIIEILNRAKKISNSHYIATLKGKKFYIDMKDNLLKSIRYKDELDNNVLITFFNQKNGIELNSSIFNVKIPDSYDVIYE